MTAQATAPPPPAPQQPQRIQLSDENYESGIGESFRKVQEQESVGGDWDQQAKKPAPGKTQGKDGKLKEAAPSIVYTGYLRLQVKRQLDTIDAITALTEQYGGYVESLTQRTVVVRVPGDDFEAVMQRFAELGEVLEHSIRATDVTQQFTDLGARLAVAREAQQRLLALLDKTEDVKERLRIVNEIKRLSEQIESIESTLSTLQNLVDFFTITLEIEPLVSPDGNLVEHSPFPWIAGLSATRTTLEDGLGDFSLRLPKSFVLFDEDDTYRAQSADTAILRGARVDNEPLGTNEFWSNAVHEEMTARGEQLVESKKAGPVTYRIYHSEDLKPRYYLIGVAAIEDDLFVVEGFFPNPASFQRHHGEVVQSLATFRVE